MLNQQQIINELISISCSKRFWIAYSGGLDSHVLLHLLVKSQHPDIEFIGAIHIDHGLNSQSADWSQHCADIAKELKVEFKSLTVEVTGIEQLGMEAAAREARYKALSSQLISNDVLLTAQHQEDQAETVLLQLLRGAGPKGLSAMARQSEWANIQLIRPLIHCSQHDILSYAKTHQLNWIDDPSNNDTRWNRNYIRHTLWPNISQRWPQAAKTFGRSAQHCAEAAELLEELALSDLTKFNVDLNEDCLPIPELLRLSTARRNNLIRYFISLKHYSMPSVVNLKRITNEVCLAKQDAVPIVSWQGVDVRRYQQKLYFMTNLMPHDQEMVIEINHHNNCKIGREQILVWKEVLGEGLAKSVLQLGLSLRFRQGGERIQPQGHQHHALLKNLLPQWNIPPWQRDRVPLLFKQDQLVAVVGYCVSEQYSVEQDEIGFLPQLCYE